VGPGGTEGTKFPAEERTGPRNTAERRRFASDNPMLVASVFKGPLDPGEGGQIVGALGLVIR